jgi:hypothetical protein
MEDDKFIAFLEKVLPDMFMRSQVSQLTNGIISSKTMQNRDTTGVGPVQHRVGTKICYDKAEFIEWARQYFTGDKYDARVEQLSEAARQRKGQEA